MWFKIQDQSVSLQIVAKPRAKRSALVKIDDDGLHIAIHASPHEGEANKELIIYLAKLFHLPKTQVILQRGENSRHKIIVMPLSHRIQEFLNNPSEFLKLLD